MEIELNVLKQREQILNSDTVKVTDKYWGDLVFEEGADFTNQYSKGYPNVTDLDDFVYGAVEAMKKHYDLPAFNTGNNPKIKVVSYKTPDEDINYSDVVVEFTEMSKQETDTIEKKIYAEIERR